MRRVVVSGIGLISSIGNNLESTWNNLISGTSGIKKITNFDTSNLSCKIAGFIFVPCFTATFPSAALTKLFEAFQFYL